MAHFAEIDTNGKVLRVIVAEQDFIDSGAVGDPKNWIQTSYNTKEGVHEEGGTPLRKNFAGIGYTYDKVRDAFIPPKPHSSWVLNEQKGSWDPPRAYPKNKELPQEWDNVIEDWKEMKTK